MANIIEKSTTKETKPETNVSAQENILPERNTFNIFTRKDIIHNILMLMLL